MADSYIFSAGKIQDLVKGSPTVILADGISLFVADMIVGCDEDADCVRLYGR
jgi:hypothetical protein